jgi:peroxiredoxin
MNTPWFVVSLGAMLLVIFASAVGEDGVRAPIQPVASRKAAPEFALQDSLGKQTSVKNYRGKVLLLDFWATWCHGCRLEIPWFAEFHNKYASPGLSVVGVSLDADGWKVIKPFLKSTNVSYRIVLGDDALAKKYGIASLPDTYLIDRNGKIAAAYSGLVDKDDVESNIKMLLAQPK